MSAVFYFAAVFRVRVSRADMLHTRDLLFLLSRNKPVLRFRTGCMVSFRRQDRDREPFTHEGGSYIKYINNNSAPVYKYRIYQYADDSLGRLAYELWNGDKHSSKWHLYYCALVL